MKNYWLRMMELDQIELGIKKIIPDIEYRVSPMAGGRIMISTGNNNVGYMSCHDDPTLSINQTIAKMIRDIYAFSIMADPIAIFLNMKYVDYDSSEKKLYVGDKNSDYVFDCPLSIQEFVNYFKNGSVVNT